MSNVIRLKIALTPKQKEVEASSARFKVLKWGRRVGKTYYEAYWLAKQAIMRADKHWYVTRTLSLGRDEFLPALLNLLPRHLVSKVDERLLNVRLTNGSTISVKSAEKEVNLRGRGLGSYVLDEAAFLRETVHSTILRPQLAVSRGPALIASSPKKGWFTRLYNDILKNPHPDFFASHATIYDNPHITHDEIEVTRSKTPERIWLQEYMAQEVADIGQVYDEFSERNVYNPEEMFADVRNYPCIAGIDYGLADPTAVAWISISPEGYLVVHSEYSEMGLDVARHAEVIKTKSSGLKITANVLDGSAFRKEATSMTSIFDLLRNCGVVCQRSDRDVQSSLDIMKRFIHGDGSVPWLYVSRNCSKLIEAFQNWEHGDHEPDILAATRYGSVWAINRRMSPLSELTPIKAAPLEDPLKDATNEMLLAHLKSRPRSKPASWSWDDQAGAPY